MSTIEYEFRLTPPSQEEITDWKVKECFSVVVAYKEGEPNGSPKLHYHGYLKGTCTIKTIQRWLNDVAESDKYGVKGNAVFFTRRVHEHTFGYISKHNDVALRIGTDQTVLDEWFARSTEYVRNKAKVKKREQRTRESELAPIWKEVKEWIKTMHSPDPDAITRQTLYLCHEQGIKFPSRSQMESFIIHALYERNPNYAIRYLNRSFDN